MNTEQNYAGQTDHATTAVQRAQSLGQSVTQATEQPAANLDREYQSLYRLVSNFLMEAGTSGPVDLVNGLLMDSVNHSAGLDPEADHEPTKQHTVTQADLNRMFSANQLTGFLVRLSEQWQHINRLRSESMNG
ncbi:hypothetical protein [Spirosoma spitsbergense]|uniref:hypothetical protein n=1 Tax=Spirosoma spitsbergense TaxID=431554 RepID=UPI000362249C|nr:hypothetical protein [Spirosoma spitsbergense]